MQLQRVTAVLAVVFAVAGATPAAAQIDYRNLDDHRPIRTEDAYPIERYAFEFLLPYDYENQRDGASLHVVAPEFAYGVARNTQVGLKLPFAVFDPGPDAEFGFGGPRLFGLYNFNTESPGLPALALRADLSLPWGDLAGDDAQLTLKAIATRSWGLTRLHLNAAASVGADDRSPTVEAEPDWSVSLAADRTLFRQSLLLVGEVAVLAERNGAPTEVTVGGGVRYQLTPTLVLDGGLNRRVTNAGPDIGITLGLSHPFAVAALLSGRRF